MKNNLPQTENITWRGIILGLLSIPVNVYLVVQTETVWTTQYPTTMSIFFNAVFTLFLFVLLNLLLIRFMPRWRLTQGELLTIYLMVTLACVVAGHDMLQATVCILGHSTWFATPENEWQSLFSHYIPDWIAVTDIQALRGYYEGSSNFLEARHLQAWLTPVLSWTLFFSAMAFSMMMLTVILRKQWIEHEKLSYPIIQLPFEMTKETRFYRNHLLWIGIAIAVGVDLINGLNFLYPQLPGIPIRQDIGRYFTEKPWSAMGSIPIYFNPYAIGIGFLMPLDLAFSCWIFYLFWKMQWLFGAITGMSQMPGYPHTGMQSQGAYLGLCLFALWATRKHLYRVCLAILFGRKSGVDDSKEPVGYRFAFLGLLLSGSVIVVFCLQAGMSLWVIGLFFLIHFALVLAFTRVRAELGTPIQDFYRAGPSFLLTSVFDTRKLGPQNLTGFAFLYGFTRNYRAQPMPNQLEGFKLADKAKLHGGQLLWVMWLASVLGLLVGFVSFLYAAYRHGSLGTWRGQEAFSDLQRWLTFPGGTDWTRLGFWGFGMALTFGTLAMRVRFIWWQLHPLAYPLSGSWGFGRLWFPVFIAWFLKTLIVRYGGLGAYRRALPLFLGTILGEFVMGSLWAILGLLLGQQMYSFKHW